MNINDNIEEKEKTNDPEESAEQMTSSIAEDNSPSPAEPDEDIERGEAEEEDEKSEEPDASEESAGSEDSANSEDSREYRAFEETDRTDKKSKKRAHSFDATRIFISYFLLSLAMPMLFSSKIPSTIGFIIAIATIALSIFVFRKFSGSKKSTVAYSATILTCMVVTGIFGAAAIASLFGCVAIVFALWTQVNTPAIRVISLSIAAAAFIVSLLSLGSLLTAAAALFHIPVSLVLSLCFMRAVPRVSSVCRASAALILTAAFPVAVWFFSKYGFDFSQLPSLVESARDYLVSLGAELFYSVLGEVSDISMTDAAILSAATVTSIFNLLPAIVVIIANILSFFLHSNLIHIFFRFETDPEKLVSSVAFSMSPVSAVVFPIAFFTALISSEVSGVSPLSVTAENISLILMVGLSYLAIGSISRTALFGKGSCLSSVIYFVILMLLFSLPVLVLTVGAFVGSWIILLDLYRQYRSR